MSKGMEILVANFHIRSAEIDLIVRDPACGYIVFVEVKCRRGTQYGLPREAVNFPKQQRIRRAAGAYIARHFPKAPDQNFRFDVVEVLHKGGKWWANHIENAF